MKPVSIAAGLAALIVITSAFAQTPQQGPDKPETNCATPSGSGQTTGSTNSMAIEKSAILPSAGGHANSAAPTVQSDGKAMHVRPNCPPDQAKSK
jgi:hypothetical protein